LNSFDYTDVYRPELFLGGFVKDMSELRALRLAALRSHVQASWEPPSTVDFGKTYGDSMAHLQLAIHDLQERDDPLWDRRIPTMVQAYFEDMVRVLTRLRAFAKPNASTWIVVSTSAYAGIELPVDLIIADIAAKSGWFLREVVVLRYLKRVSCQQWTELSQRGNASGPFLRESLIVLDAAPRKGR
jgi:hypothetical protein